MKTLQDLAAAIFQTCRYHQRNCRCPKCHKESLQCVECPECAAILNDLILDQLRAVNSSR